jgi:hypothetical protein
VQKLEREVETLLVAWRAEYDRLVAQHGAPTHDWRMVTDEYVCTRCGERRERPVGDYTQQPPAKACVRR